MKFHFAQNINLFNFLILSFILYGSDAVYKWNNLFSFELVQRKFNDISSNYDNDFPYPFDPLYRKYYVERIDQKLVFDKIEEKINNYISGSELFILLIDVNIDNAIYKISLTVKKDIWKQISWNVWESKDKFIEVNIQPTKKIESICNSLIDLNSFMDGGKIMILDATSTYLILKNKEVISYFALYAIDELDDNELDDNYEDPKVKLLLELRELIRANPDIRKTIQRDKLSKKIIRHIDDIKE